MVLRLIVFRPFHTLTHSSQTVSSQYLKDSSDLSIVIGGHSAESLGVFQTSGISFFF